MRPRRPYITTLADVTINRSGESAVIVYRDRAALRAACRTTITNPGLRATN